MEERKFGEYTLFIGDRGFYLTDGVGTVVIDASILDGMWPVELCFHKSDREFYFNVEPNKDVVTFGFGKRE